MKILIAEDDSTSRIVLENTLQRRGYEVISVRDGGSSLEVLLGADPPRIALLDWMMPSPNGIEVCQEVRRHIDSTKTYIFIILLTGKHNMEEIIQGLEAGADDYVTKPYNTEELELRIRAGQRVIDLQDALLEAQRLLRVQADHDSLTGVLNRGAIMRHASNELARSFRAGAPLGLAMIDIDHFKSINDNHGHQCGDAVLREVVTRIQSAIRPYDVLGRYGGEEFLLVLPGLVEGDTHPLERLRKVVGETPVTVGTGEIPVTVSTGAGWAMAGDELEDLIRDVDTALYAAKKGGRNRVACARREPGEPPGPAERPPGE